jgi:hypothetical protein
VFFGVVGRKLRVERGRNLISDGGPEMLMSRSRPPQTAHAIATVICLIPDPLDLVRIRAAVREMGEVRGLRLRVVEAATWSAARDLILCEAAGLVLVDAGGPDGFQSMLESTIAIRRHAPSVPVVIWGGAAEVPPEAWMKLRDAGVQGVISEGARASRGSIAFELGRAAGLSLPLDAIEALSPVVPPWGLRLLRKALPLAHRGLEDDGEGRLSVSLLADLWVRGGSPEGLTSALRRASLPPPGWMVRWLIVLRGVGLRSILPTWEAVAWELGFRSRRDLRRFVRRLTGRAPTEVSASHLEELFRARCGAGPSEV